MVKIKRVRTADAVVAAFRFGKEPDTVGSLILGLYDDDGKLHIVGHTSSFRAKQKRELLELLEPYRTGERGSGEPSRWKSEEELVWEGLRPELVCEVSFDHITGDRIRHGAKFLRWRTDKEPARMRARSVARLIPAAARPRRRPGAGGAGPVPGPARQPVRERRRRPRRDLRLRDAQPVPLVLRPPHRRHVDRRRRRHPGGGRPPPARRHRRRQPGLELPVRHGGADRLHARRTTSRRCTPTRAARTS